MERQRVGRREHKTRVSVQLDPMCSGRVGMRSDEKLPLQQEGLLLMRRCVSEPVTTRDTHWPTCIARRASPQGIGDSKNAEDPPQFAVSPIVCLLASSFFLFMSFFLQRMPALSLCTRRCPSGTVPRYPEVERLTFLKSKGPRNAAAARATTPTIATSIDKQRHWRENLEEGEDDEGEEADASLLDRETEPVAGSFKGECLQELPVGSPVLC